MIFLRINLIPFYVKHFELPLCMKCIYIYIYINLPCLAFMLSSLPASSSYLLLGGLHGFKGTDSKTFEHFITNMVSSMFAYYLHIN